MATQTTTLICQAKRGPFLRCSGEAVGLCQYCGRHFCLTHADLLEEHQSVCARRNCVAKRRDLEKHLDYKDFVYARNAARQCGIDACKHLPDRQCVRCRGHFCGLHVESRDEMILVNRVRTNRMAVLCQHCWSRRPIWVRT